MCTAGGDRQRGLAGYPEQAVVLPLGVFRFQRIHRELVEGSEGEGSSRSYTQSPLWLQPPPR